MTSVPRLRALVLTGSWIVALAAPPRAWALEPELDVFDYAHAAASSYVAAVQACGAATGALDDCGGRTDRNSRLTSFRARNDIEQFYLRCQSVMHDDRPSCDGILASFVARAIESGRQEVPPQLLPANHGPPVAR
ncbi:MAG: hypothetical protein REJ50_23845 [Bordetella sp.]|nr:hypothetical protein [Bordetella sp.]